MQQPRLLSCLDAFPVCLGTWSVANFLFYLEKLTLGRCCSWRGLGSVGRDAGFERFEFFLDLGESSFVTTLGGGGATEGFGGGQLAGFGWGYAWG